MEREGGQVPGGGKVSVRVEGEVVGEAAKTGGQGGGQVSVCGRRGGQGSGKDTADERGDNGAQ